MNWLRRNPLKAYFGWAYGVSWCGVLAVIAANGFELAAIGAEDFLPIFAAMVLGPCSAGLALTGAIEGKDGLLRLARSLLRWRVGLRWFAVALLTTPVLLLPILWLLSATLDPDFAPQFHVPLFAMGLVAGLFEEIGWTGFAAPRLLQRYSMPIAGFVLGLVWMLWHALADFAGNAAMMGPTWIAWFALFWAATLPPYRMLMTWIYARTESVLLGVLMHAGYTGWLFVLSPSVSLQQGLIWQGLFAAGLWMSAIALGLRASRSGATAA